jgi:hypothetical protein
MLAPRRTQAQKLIEAAQNSQVAQVAGGAAPSSGGENMMDRSPLTMARRRGARSADQVLAQSAAADRGTSFLANRMGGMGMGMSGGSSLRPGMLPGMMGMSSQFSMPGSRLRKRAVQGFSGSGI